jgi:very-short-patch-repair endonuclease
MVLERLLGKESGVMGLRRVEEARSFVTRTRVFRIRATLARPAGKRDAGGEEGDARNEKPRPQAPGELTARVALRGQGTASRTDLLDAGLSRHVIDRRARTGDLHRVHRGLYLVGHTALAPRAAEFAAILACGDRAVISHRSAAFLWGMIERRPAEVDVTLVGRRCRAKEGIRLHLLSQIDERRDVRCVENLPITSPARTLVDLAAASTTAELERALNEARAQRLVNDGQLRGVLTRAGRRPGTALLRKLLINETESGFTRKEAERLMRRLLHDADLAQPHCNAKIRGMEVDFCWAEQRLIVEVDGFQFHGHRSAFERDRKKDQLLTAAGYTVIRVTWRQLRDEPIRVAAVIAAALSAGMFALTRPRESSAPSQR